jgi:hypothetical protein
MTSSHALSGKSSRARCAKNSGRRSARFRVQTITEILGRGVVSADATLGPAGEIASCDVVMCQSGAMLLRSSNPSSVGSSSAGRRKQIAWSRPQNRSSKVARRNFYTDDPAAMTQVGAESSTEFARLACSIAWRSPHSCQATSMPLSRLTFRGMTAVTMAVNAPLDAVRYTLDLPPSLSAEDIAARDYQNQTSGFHQAAGIGRMSDACWRRTRADAASSSCSATPRRWISDRRTTALVCSSMRSADHRHASARRARLV